MEDSQHGYNKNPLGWREREDKNKFVEYEAGVGLTIREDRYARVGHLSQS